MQLSAISLDSLVKYGKMIVVELFILYLLSFVTYTATQPLAVLYVKICEEVDQIVLANPWTSIMLKKLKHTLLRSSATGELSELKKLLWLKATKSNVSFIDHFGMYYLKKKKDLLS